MPGQIILKKVEGGKLDPEHTLYVSPSFSDDPASMQFSTIESANNYAITLLNPVVDWNESIVIKVAPGLYEEQITNSHRRIFIVGDGKDFENWPKSVILYNTGADAKHYPIGCKEYLNLSDMQVMVDSGGVYGELVNRGLFSLCVFDGGAFIEQTTPVSLTTYYNFCYFGGGKGFDLSGTINNSRFIALRRCDLSGTDALFGSSGTGTKTIKFDKSMTGTDSTTISGNWSLLCYNTEKADTNSRLIIDTDGFVNIVSSVITVGIHFKSDTLLEKKMVSCMFKDTPSGESDISADVTITDVIYSGNNQQNGICGCIQIRNPEKHIGTGRNDRYFDLQSAIDSIPTGSDATVRIWENLTNLPEIVLTNPNTNIKIKGQKAYSLSFVGDIVEVGPDRILGFNDMVNLSGGKIELNGANSEIGFESCQYIEAYLKLTLGDFAIIYKSSFFGSTGKAAVYIDNLATIDVIGYSRVQGSVGNPAVLFSVEADSKFKAKFSTFIHGDKGANAPLVYLGANKVDIAVYSCGLNAVWNADDFTNTIGSANNTVDPNITF